MKICNKVDAQKVVWRYGIFITLYCFLQLSQLDLCGSASASAVIATGLPA